MKRERGALWGAMVLGGLLGCGSSDSGPAVGGGTGGSSAGAGGTASAGAAGGAGKVQGPDQVPPASGAEIPAWIAGGAYLKWHCEKAPHAAVASSPHAINRICSNDLLSAAGPGEYPVDSATVKELVDANGVVYGHAVARHMKPGKGESWYWYEIVGTKVFADGLGDKGDELGICVKCHADAGLDAKHPGHDLIYTQVK